LDEQKASILNSADIKALNLVFFMSKQTISEILGRSGCFGGEGIRRRSLSSSPRSWFDHFLLVFASICKLCYHKDYISANLEQLRKKTARKRLPNDTGEPPKRRRPKEKDSEETSTLEIFDNLVDFVIKETPELLAFNPEDEGWKNADIRRVPNQSVGLIVKGKYFRDN